MKVVIVGAGPSGLMAAGLIKSGAVTVLEKNEKPGKKLYITGKGRCNVTNHCTPSRLLESVVSNPKFLYSAVHRFSPRDAVGFFENAGVPLKTERGGRVFPQSDKASDITAALTRHAVAHGAQIRYHAEVKEIKAVSEGGFNVELTGGEKLFCDALVLASGGKSYPATGSTGDGYRFAESLGHRVIPPRPALVPILLDECVQALEGLSLKNITAGVTGANSKIQPVFGEMLFTANGVSGPAVLSLSSHVSRAGFGRGAKICIDLKPALSEDVLDLRLLREFEAAKNKQLKTVLHTLMPKSLAVGFAVKAGVNAEMPVNEVTKQQRGALIRTLKNLTFLIKGLDGIEKGVVTQGGVDVTQLRPTDMESKLISNLYFVGELLDVDALTGGYNIQIALSSGYAAGLSIENKNRQLSQI
ncbi:MAG: NAD(P)/FAD-dependent oxidoreductase [Firmicutes bacterium]|nr:NAD(P)/FAD-dependent oxidoreductase [Bacillota bacterium]